MIEVRRLFACCIVACAALCVSGSSPHASEGAFPFDRELILDAAPMRGSKRVPIIEIAENGSASIQLWCTSLNGQASVSADSITIVAGEAEPGRCSPEHQNGDASLLSALTQVTNWRRHGDVIEFLGATTLRFRLMTN